VAEDYRTIIGELEAYGGDAGRQAARHRAEQDRRADDEERAERARGARKPRRAGR
jgi:hypothetical protein